MGRVHLRTGRRRKYKGPPINWKAEKQMHEFQRVLDKDKEEYDKQVHWKRIPKQN